MSDRRLLAADVLTASRLVVAVALVATSPSAGVVSLLVGWAWFSDAADGTLARSADGEGRLGRLDPAVDAAVAVGALWYLGHVGFLAVIPSRVGAAFLVALWLATGRLAVQMLLAALSYGAVLWWALAESVPGWWLLPLVASSILLLEWTRFVSELVPRFLNGWRELLTWRHDTWA